MPRLKGVIFSLRDVVVKQGNLNQELFNELEKLIKWLQKVELTPIFVGNSMWQVNNSDGTKISFKDYITSKWGDFHWFIAQEGSMPYKPQKAAMNHVLKEMGWETHEVVYVGNTDDDMKTARNGGILFLNALWHGETNEYGFQFDSPKDIARFIDCFYIGIDDWFWALETVNLNVYALAPFSTLSTKYEDAKGYSYHARNTAKSNTGDPIFWGRLLASSVYLSGLANEISYITSYPGHSTASTTPSVNEALSVFADCVNAKFIPDLLIRHTDAQKSQTLRAAGKSVGHKNQIDTIHLNSKPQKNKKGEPYKAPPLRKNKTVLIVDDFCTEGNSFEAARAYITATGANVICLSWLKTINTDYKEMNPLVKIDKPYEPNKLDETITIAKHEFSNHIKNPSATSDLNSIFKKYYEWNWPA